MGDAYLGLASQVLGTQPRRGFALMRGARGPVRALALVVSLVTLAVATAGCTSLGIAAVRRFSAPGPPDVPEGTVATRDIVFTRTTDGPLVLDVYRPETPADEKLPVVLYTFGGGWIIGNRHQVGEFGYIRLVDHGYAVVAADYRYSTTAIFPAQIHDVKAALRWIRANADEHGFDPARVAILGPSAGGHLAALAGTSGDVPSLDGDFAEWTPSERKLSTRVQAVVDFFGPTDLSVYREQHRENGIGDTGSLDVFLDPLLGGPVAENLARAGMASPIAYATPDDPPFLIIHGDADPVVPYQQSLMLRDALENVGVDVTLLTIEGGNHGRTPVFTSQELLDEIASWLDEKLAVSR